MPAAPTLNKVLVAVYALCATGVLVGALLWPPLREIAYAPVRDGLIPPPEPIVVSVLYSTEKAEWLTEAVARFAAGRPRIGGRPIELAMAKTGSREMYLSVLDGSAQPDLISPASSLQIHLLRDLSEDRFGAPLVSPADRDLCRSILTTPVVIVAWRERADVLWGDDPGGELWTRLHAALTDPQGWAALDRPEWGFVKFSHTNPLTSNSGFQTILLATYAYFDKTAGLTTTNILGDAGYQAWFTEFESAISRFGDSTGTYMEEIVAYGPSLYDMVAVYESTMVEQAENAVGRYGELRAFYPPATHLSDHPFCILEADWVQADEAQAARLFVDFLGSREMQELALLDHGFRPVDPSILLDQPGSPLRTYAGNGLRLDLPPTVEVPDGEVLATLLDFWDRTIGP